MSPTTRREFLKTSALGLATLGASTWLPGCARDAQGDVPDAAPTAADGALDATPECAETDDNIEGPFYKEGAPYVSALADAQTTGTPLLVSGRVLDTSCAPLAGALLDVWQANDAGQYDLTGYTLRGKLLTDAAGNYQLRTIVPGHYLNGAQYRPAHIHVKASAPGTALLTTQLYFAGDPYNAIDPFIKPSLIMTVVPGEAVSLARFDFVLVPATG
jgi:protocatechuate 3,4-dioxygenase beta subunit